MRSGTPPRTGATSEQARQTVLERELAHAFWRAVSTEPMPIMATLEAAARTVGDLYRRAARAHAVDGACGCGWQPEPDTDLIVLEAMLAAAVLRADADDAAGRDRPDLAGMTVAGRA